MPTFEYTAIDRGGRTRSGTLASPDSEAARLLLTGRGLVATRILAAGSPTATALIKLNPNALAVITRQLSTLVTVSPVEEALRTLAEQSESKKQREVLMRVHIGVIEGLRLSEAMGRLGPAFPPTYRAMVAAGETSGSLPQILERLADLLEKRQDMHSKITSALVYPIVLAVVALCVIVALMTFVVPKVVEQFDVSGQALPALTLAMIAISGLMVNWGWVIALAAAGCLACAAWLLSQSGPRLAFDGALLRLPVIGRMLRNVEGAGLARSLATMIASGLPILEALQLAARTTGNSVVRAAINNMGTSVHEGGGLSTAMRRAKVFPPLLVNLAASGESGGKLEPMLDRAADYLERDFRTATSVALSLLEPAIIVVMGGIVCLVILSILLPILQINTLVLKHAQRSGQAGFSLIEVMVTIVIIGLLSTVVLLNVLPSRDKAMVEKAKTDIAVLEQALDTYKLEMLSYPRTDDGLEALVTPPANLVSASRFRSEGYIRRLPEDPWGNAYRYAYPGRASAYDVYSLGADGEPGGEGLDADIGNWK